MEGKNKWKASNGKQQNESSVIRSAAAFEAE